jgi:threonine dehydratase
MLETMPSESEAGVTAADVRAAAGRLAGLAHRTPVVTSAYFDQRAGARLVFKCEQLQRVGAFKFRGAANAVLALSADAAAHGVITHSSGNHGQAVALAARLRGIPATVVMPDDSAAPKIAAVRGYGAEVVLCPPGTASREAATAKILAATGATLIHPYNDAFVIAGQGTACLELLNEVPTLDAVIAPVGGGGLLAGTALAAELSADPTGLPSTAARRPPPLVFGAEPAAADDAARSLASGALQTAASTQTIADGLRSASLGKLNFAVLLPRVREVLTVEERDIVAAMRLVFERMKLVIEPSAAVAVAAVLGYPDRFRGLQVGVILSGGNVDLDRLPWMAP